jgi:hypothetical protein
MSDVDFGTIGGARVRESDEYLHVSAREGTEEEAEPTPIVLDGVDAVQLGAALMVWGRKKLDEEGE